MKWRTFEIQRSPGFRLNLTDLVLLVSLVVVSLLWWSVFPEQHLYLLPIYVGASFFLFCNVFRIGNRMEAPWYLTFVGLVVYGVGQASFPWMLLLVVCEALKWGLIGYTLWRLPYHGAFYQQVLAWRGEQ